jgi:hypothetical protein
MLKYVGDTGGVPEYGLKGHTEGIFGVIVADVNMPGTGRKMLQRIKNRRDLL